MHSPLQEVRLVNAEHEIQLHLIREIRQALGDGRDASEIVSRLRAWHLAHCESEELLMRRHAYPGYDLHADEHRRISAILDAPITVPAAADLSALVRRHIRERDSQLHAYLEQFETGQE